ncbi:hypothetical protein Hanom_Chr11g01004121 [Helianthus anomalus]
MWSQVLSGVHFLKDLAYLLPLCNEDTSLVMPALIILGCDNWFYKRNLKRRKTVFNIRAPKRTKSLRKLSYSR